MSDPPADPFAVPSGRIPPPAPAGWIPPPAPAGWQPARPKWGVPEYDEPQPYHRILNSRSYRVWRPLVGIPVGVVVFVVLAVALSVATLIPALMVGGVDVAADDSDLLAELFSDPLGLLLVNLSLAPMIAAAMLALLAGHQMRPGWLHSVIGRMRWGFLGLCLAVEVGVTLVVLPLAGLLGGPLEEPAATVETLSLAAWLPFALVILLTTPLQAAAEEYGFRGYGLQALGSWVRNPWFAIIVTALLFAAAHGAQDLPLFLNRFAFGVVAGYLTIRTGGLEAAIGIHVVNNVVILLLASATGQLGESLTVSETSWVVSVVDVGGMVLYAAIILWLARRRGLATRTVPSPPAPPLWPVGSVATPMTRVVGPNPPG